MAAWARIWIEIDFLIKLRLRIKFYFYLYGYLMNVPARTVYKYRDRRSRRPK